MSDLETSSTNTLAIHPLTPGDVAAEIYQESIDTGHATFESKVSDWRCTRHKACAFLAPKRESVECRSAHVLGPGAVSPGLNGIAGQPVWTNYQGTEP